ncbi:protein TAP1-like [Impatiens glandulifera]|uniref:protein TAP1-like n=1 Tax=Impatiens glandulifera TaxID=253017 RepID=UPI001FB17E0C|nr:protein TAP1-like [Impatiens glandulifera]
MSSTYGIVIVFVLMFLLYGESANTSSFQQCLQKCAITCFITNKDLNARISCGVQCIPKCIFNRPPSLMNVDACSLKCSIDECTKLVADVEKVEECVVACGKNSNCKTKRSFLLLNQADLGWVALLAPLLSFAAAYYYY